MIGLSLETGKKIPVKEVEKAVIVFDRYKLGLLQARKMCGTDRHKVLEVGRRYRILITPHKAELLSHEDYNKYTRKSKVKAKTLRSGIGNGSSFRQK